MNVSDRLRVVANGILYNLATLLDMLRCLSRRPPCAIRANALVRELLSMRVVEC